MPQVAPATKPLHIFKPGRWTTVAGETIEFGDADLAATAAAYDPKIHKAPIVKGHPALDAPAQGWADQLVVQARGLYALPSKVDPAFAEEARTGRWGTVSAKFYRPDATNNPVPGVWYLRHIGVLGAHPPGVKGLDDPEFGDADDGCVCFAEGVAFGEWDAMTTANLLRNLREWVLGKFGQEDADKVLPNYDVRALELSAAETVNETRQAQGLPVAFAQGEASPTDPPPKESAVTEEEAARLRTENEAQARQIAVLQAADKERKQAAVLAENAAFAESMAGEARIPTALKGQVAAIGAQLQAAPDVAFGEGADKKPLHQVFRDLLQALPKQVEFGEQATRERAAGDGADATTPVEFAEGADPDRVALDKRIRAHAKEHKVDYATAAHAVMRNK
ncbi:peptidase [Acidovorax sp. SUPP3334]|uniref:peptidase n=1 Tax=Acidovorax sp. SUPP3334 TaxID=2920881 RepID=UPI0023DE6663|nr:peptidase [Acidovorax sp. SUPP3334]GKT22534.1 peptidase [Acidovorax sp. SUPP3334]